MICFINNSKNADKCEQYTMRTCFTSIGLFLFLFYSDLMILGTVETDRGKDVA